MSTQITIDLVKDGKFYVVCGQCERRAAIVWYQVNPYGFTCILAHVLCHGEHRFVEICQYHQRVAEHLGQGALAMLWEQLIDADAKHWLERAEEVLAECRRVIEDPDSVPDFVHEMIEHERRMTERAEAIRHLLSFT